MADKYSDEELQEFKEIILNKLAEARKDYALLLETATMLTSSNDIQDTSPTFKNLEDGAAVLTKSESGKLAERQAKFIEHLEAALMRIENKTYGVCRKTGQLIPKARLRLVPHATLCIEAKQ